MNIPQFNITLLSPTSTSVHLEVAIKFSGQKGIIIEFNNESDDGGEVKGLDVSWLSRFREEDERLFMGWNWHTLGINSIRIIESHLNFKQIVKVIGFLDSCVSGLHYNIFNDNPEKGLKYIVQFWNYLSVTFIPKYDKRLRFNQYVYDTFNCYINHKTEFN